MSRPIIHHLNADTSWLLQVPRPDGGFFSILIDPWLQGPQSDVAAWFSTQEHAIPSAYQTISEVEKLASKNNSKIDAVVVSHEFTDHCHKETLEEVDPNVPVFAPKAAADLIRSWSHFHHVSELEAFKSDWHGGGLLPESLSIKRIEDEADSLYYHSAVVIIFKSMDISECVIYTPHGVPAHALARLNEATPPVSVLCFIHGLHDVRLYGMRQLNLGGRNGLEGQRLVKPKYWLTTHDEVKKGGGIVSWFLWRNVVAVKDALIGDKDAPICDEVGNGETRVLI